PVCLTPVSAAVVPPDSTVAVTAYFFPKPGGILCVLHSFPTRRSSDLTTSVTLAVRVVPPPVAVIVSGYEPAAMSPGGEIDRVAIVRKCRRLYCSHEQRSYVVLCLKRQPLTVSPTPVVAGVVPPDTSLA